MDTHALAAVAAQQTAVLLAAIEAMETTLALAAALAGEGRAIDLGGLDDEVERICCACLAAPGSTVGAVRARLIGLRGQVDRLTAVLADH